MSTIPALGNRTIEQLKVPELKEELRKRGILSKGLKKDLVERLEQALREENGGGGIIGSQFVTGDIVQDAFLHDSECQEDASDYFKPQEDTSTDNSEPQGDALLVSVETQEDVVSEGSKPHGDSEVVLDFQKDEEDISQVHNDAPNISKSQESASYPSKDQEDLLNLSKDQENFLEVVETQVNLIDVSKPEKESSNVFKPQEGASLGLLLKKDSFDVENATLESRSGPKECALPSPFPSNEVRTELPLVEIVPVAEDVKVLDPLSAEGISKDTMYSSEERKSAVETSLPVTTGFEIASSDDMETNVIVQSIPGFDRHSDLLPGTLCEAGYQGRVGPSISQESVKAHEIRDSVEIFKQGCNEIGDPVEAVKQDHKVEKNGIYPYPINCGNHSEVKPEKVPLGDSVVSEKGKVDEVTVVATSSVYSEPESTTEVSVLTADEIVVEVKTTSEMRLDILKTDTIHSLTHVAGVSETCLVESEHSTGTFNSNFVQVSQSVETVKCLIPEEAHLEDKNVEDKNIEISVTDRDFTEAKIVDRPCVISEAPFVKSDSLVKAIQEVEDSLPGEDTVSVSKSSKGMVSLVRENRRAEAIEISSRDGSDARKEEYKLQKFDREVPWDKREISRSRLGQEGIAKLKEEVEKAGLKERGLLESGFRRSEPRVKRELLEEKVDLRTLKEELEITEGLERIHYKPQEKDVKPMDIDSGGLKRKEPDEDSRQAEPLKRQRRWNSEKTSEAESEVKPFSKSISKERQKDIVPLKAEARNDFSLLASRTSPSSSKDLIPSSKGAATGILDKKLGAKYEPHMPKTEDASNEDSMIKRIIPAPTRSPTTSLRIDGFVRPLTLLAVKNLLARTGTYHNFWMDHIKSHCYVRYSTVDEAVATRNALYNLQWPQIGGKMLVAEFVDPTEVELKLDSASDKPIASPMATPRPVASLNDQMSPLSSGQSTGHIPAPIFAPPPPIFVPPPPPPRREKPSAPPPFEKVQEPAIITVDDLFKKTQAKPHIYYLPLTEEQANAALARKKESVNKARS